MAGIQSQVHASDTNYSTGAAGGFASTVWPLHSVVAYGTARGAVIGWPTGRAMT